MFIGREGKLSSLNKLYESDKFEAVANGASHMAEISAKADERTSVCASQCSGSGIASFPRTILSSLSELPTRLIDR